MFLLESRNGQISSQSDQNYRACTGKKTMATTPRYKINVMCIYENTCNVVIVHNKVKFYKLLKNIFVPENG